MDIGPYKAKLVYREMPSTKICFRCHKTGHTEAMCRTGSPDRETGSGTAVVPQTKLSTPEIAEEQNEQEEEKEEASKQSHDELTSNQVIINTKLQKNEIEELPVQGKHEHEDMSSRKKKKMNKSRKRKNNPKGNIYSRDRHSEGASYASCSSDNENTQAKSNNIKENERKKGERGVPHSGEIDSRLTSTQVESEEEQERNNERNKETDIRNYLQRARSLSCKRVYPDTPSYGKEPSSRKARGENK